MAETTAKGLGKIQGLCACYTNKTLNGRGYAEIYKRILAGEDYRYNEMMRRGGILCELGHPSQVTADFERTETDPGEACVLITNIEEREHGKLYADGIILDTPKGRIYKAMMPYYKFGFSSRGSYEADEDNAEGPNGWNQDSYVFKGFDIVALPANEGSEISAVESVGGKKRHPHIKRKSAREALDLQNIAEAANVDPKEVDAELDKLFSDDGSLEPVKLVDARTFTEDMKPEGEKEGSTLLLDLHKALSDKTELEKQVQKLLFEKAENEAAVISLNAQVADLQKVLEEANTQIAFYMQNKEEIQQLIDKLVATHEGAMAQADETLAVEQEKSKSLAAQVAELKQQAADAQEEASLLYDSAEGAKESTARLVASQEQIKKLNASVESLTKQLAQTKKELATANESISTAQKTAAEAKRQATGYYKMAIAAREELVETYARVYSIDKRALASKIGKSGDVKVIKSAAESLSADALRFSGYSTSAPVRQKSAKESVEASFPIMDDVDREMFEALKRENKLQ
ncbi:MAG: hypothetical protein NC218_02520 [Acetobacter sp.]|nr:hypothetical protein [Acetobacter sp.]